jgi:S-adenosylmethionine-diacylglycerol 3-amino-3-carboxypropyl transferase
MSAPLRSGARLSALGSRPDGSREPRAEGRERLTIDTRSGSPIHRRRVDGARDDRLYFGQVREDPLLEIEALRPTMADRVVVVTSGGCTALSLLAAGAGEVIAVDLNRTQNHLLELKAAAVAALSARGAIAFLGAAHATAAARLRAYRALREMLGDDARDHWDARPADVGRGVLTVGVSERFIALVVRAMRVAVHGDARVRRLLACRTLDEQRALYEREWDTRRWRWLFSILLGRHAFDRAYDPVFFLNVENPSFARHFLELARHALTEVPVASNYFLHQMLTGRYPAGVPEGVPPYLSEAGAAAVAAGRARLSAADADVASFLRAQPARSVSCFALSNVCEWLDPDEIDELFEQVARTATRGARLCFRNFVGWTEVPARWRSVVVEDRAAGERMMPRDRSVVQRRIAVCRVVRAGEARP